MAHAISTVAFNSHENKKITSVGLSSILVIRVYPLPGLEILSFSISDPFPPSCVSLKNATVPHGVVILTRNAYNARKPTTNANMVSVKGRRVEEVLKNGMSTILTCKA